MNTTKLNLLNYARRSAGYVTGRAVIFEKMTKQQACLVEEIIENLAALETEYNEEVKEKLMTIARVIGETIERHNRLLIAWKSPLELRFLDEE